MPPRKNGNTRIPHKSNVRATPDSILDAQMHGKNVGTLKTMADDLMRKGEDVAMNKTTSDLTVQKQGLGELLRSIDLYNSLISFGPRDPDLPKFVASRDHAISYALKIKANIQNNLMMKHNPGLANAIELNKQTSGMTADDAQIRQKIMATEQLNPCGFRTFEDYVDGMKFEKYLTENIINMYKYKNFKEAIGNKAFGVMLFGPPGSGKTLLAEAMGSALKSRFFLISGSDVKGKYVGESDKSMRAVFDVAREATMGGEQTVIVCFDEAEELFKATPGESAGQNFLNIILPQMDGIGARNKGMIVVFITNYPDVIPPAILDRCATKTYIGWPTIDGARQSLVQKLNKVGRVRYNLNVDTVNGKIREKFIDNWLIQDGGIKPEDLAAAMSGTKGFESIANHRRAKFDDIDLMCLALYDANLDILGSSEYIPLPYSQRQIDAIFKKMEIIAANRAIRFYLDDPPHTMDNQQVWIADRSKYTVKEGEGLRCVTKEYMRYAFIPIKFYGATIGPGIIGTDVDRLGPKSDPKHGIKRVVTMRTKGVDGYWTYKVVMEENENGMLESRGEGLIIDNMASILGHSQITMEDFNQAVSEISPTTIKNARDMLNFLIANKLGTPLDRQRLQDIAEALERLKQNNPVKYDKMVNPNVAVLGDFLKDLSSYMRQYVPSDEAPANKGYTQGGINNSDGIFG